jgi:hypothetical protein
MTAFPTTLTERLLAGSGFGVGVGAGVSVGAGVATAGAGVSLGRGATAVVHETSSTMRRTSGRTPVTRFRFA